MKDIRWERAFPPVPAQVHAALEKALKEKNEPMMKKRMRPAMVAALALAALLLLAGIAYAATQWGILDYLVGGEEHASVQLKASVQQVQATRTTDDVQIDLTGAVYDGDRLSLSFRLENLAPEKLCMVTLDAVTLNGEPAPFAFNSARDEWLPAVFAVDVPGVARNPRTGGVLSMQLPARYSGVVRGEATFVVERPVSGKLAVVDPVLWYDYARVFADSPDVATDYEERRNAILKSDAVMADAFELEPAYWLQAGYTVVDADGGFLLEDYRYSDLAPEEFGRVKPGLDVTERPGQMYETARVVVPFEIDADLALKNRVELTPARFELPDCTVYIDQALLTPLSTIIRMRVEPNGISPETLAQRYALVRLLDETGLPGKTVDYHDMEGETSGSFADEALSCYEIIIEEAGLATLPKELRFEPYSPMDGETIPAETLAARKAFTDTVRLPLP